MGTNITRLIAAFATGTLVSGALTAAVAVYWFRDFDPKFRDVPAIAFEIEIWGVLALTLIGALTVGISAYLFRNRLPVTRTSIVFCCVCGVAYPLVLRLIGNAFKAILGIESLAFPIVAWVYLFSFPVLCVFYLQAPRSAHDANAA